MVRSIAYPVDGARVPSTEVQAPQLWVLTRPSVIQYRTGMRIFIPFGDFCVATHYIIIMAGQRTVTRDKGNSAEPYSEQG
jgi:hypothetical protein